nr:glycosyltransferase family A protein [uncultured Brevundimonas sp.]
MSEPLATLITRTYGDRRQFLERAASCVFSQTAGPIEWIVAEDGPGTAGLTLSKLVLPEHVSVRHLALPKGGRSRAANAGLDAATGEFVGFYDDDDELFPQHVNVLVELLRNSPTAAGAYAASYEARRYRNCSSDTEENVFLRPSANSMVLMETNPFPIQAVLFRRSARYHQRFAHHLDALEDWLFWIEIFLERKLVWTTEVTSRFYILGDAEDEAARLKPHQEAEADFKIQVDGLFAERGLWDYGKIIRTAQSRLDSTLSSVRLASIFSTASIAD